MSQRFSSTDTASTTVEMVEQDLHKMGKMDWWYRFAAPPEPSSAAPFSQREAYRRGRLISLALLLQLAIVILLLPTVGLFVNHALIPNLAINQFLQARSRAQNGYVPWQQTNTPVDVLVQQHNGFVQSARLAQALESPDAPAIS